MHPIIYKFSFNEFAKTKKDFLEKHFNTLLVKTKEQISVGKLIDKHIQEMNIMQQNLEKKKIKEKRMKESLFKKLNKMKSAYNNKMILDLIIKNKKLMNQIIEGENDNYIKSPISNHNKYYSPKASSFKKKNNWFLTEVNNENSKNIMSTGISEAKTYTKTNIRLNSENNIFGSILPEKAKNEKSLNNRSKLNLIMGTCSFNKNKIFFNRSVRSFYSLTNQNIKNNTIKNYYNNIRKSNPMSGTLIPSPFTRTIYFNQNKNKAFEKIKKNKVYRELFISDNKLKKHKLNYLSV